jgi:hypothetical protein
VRTQHRHAFTGPRRIELASGGRCHQAARKRADDGDCHAQAQRPAEGLIRETTAPQRHRNGDGGDCLHDDGEAHD